MATYKNTDKIISHLNDKIEACGNTDIDYSPIAFGTKLGLLSAKSFIETAETADVQKVRHGKWKVCGMFDNYAKCSCCSYKEPSYHVFYNGFKYCPMCGAKMDEKE